MTEALDRFLSGVARRDTRVGIIGMGYVGLPLALAFADKGFTVTGFDVDPTKPEKLARGESYFAHIPAADVSRAVTDGRLSATTDFAAVSDMDAVIICVPTPLAAGNEPDLQFIISTAENITPHLRAGQLVSLESTTYPGTSSGVLKPILEKSGLLSGKDFFLAYSPEREDPGTAGHSTAAIPKVVGGDGPDALTAALALYDAVVAETVPVSSMDTAEAAKLTENIFRAVNIALVNELKLVYGKMGIDVWEVIDAAKTKPFGFMPFYPGPGLGGHCIPIDPFYLTWRARQVGMDTRFIELAGEINTSMPGHVIDALADALGQRGNALSGARILLLGIAYKKDVDDVRESPAFALIEGMEAAGATVDFYDPLVSVIPPSREHAALAGRASVDWAPDAIASYDATLICTDHSAVDYDALVAASTLVIDTRNATRNVAKGRDKIVKA